MPFMRTTWYRIDQALPRTPCVYGLMDSAREKMFYIGQAKHLDEAIAAHAADPADKFHEYEPKLICVEEHAMDEVRQRRYEVLLSEYSPQANS